MTEADFQVIYADWKKCVKSENITITVLRLMEAFLCLVVPVSTGIFFSWYWSLFSLLIALFILTPLHDVEYTSFTCVPLLTEEDSVKFFEDNRDFVGYLAVLREHGEVRPISEHEKSQLKEMKNKSRYSLMYKEMFEKSRPEV